LTEKNETSQEETSGAESNSPESYSAETKSTDINSGGKNGAGAGSIPESGGIKSIMDEINAIENITSGGSAPEAKQPEVKLPETKQSDSTQGENKNKTSESNFHRPKNINQNRNRNRDNRNRDRDNTNREKKETSQDVKSQENKSQDNKSQEQKEHKPQERRQHENKNQDNRQQDNRNQNKNQSLRKNSNQKRFNPREGRQQQQTPQLSLAGKSVSVVIPLYNEEDSLVELSVSLKKVLDSLRCQWEVIFIDDGSTDSSYKKLEEINRVNKSFKCLKFKRNYGKSSALHEGFKAATGDYVITMDADLQDDPEEIPALISKLNEGYDLVSGWKKIRHDPFIKKHTSKLFNLVTSMMVGLRLHDYNCGIKAYIKDVVKNIKVYGEMHRYIPALAHLSGYKVTEIPVTHYERKYGKTKFGLSRFYNGLFDLITVLFTTKYIKRPLHLFGFLGVACSMAGFGILIYLTVVKFVESVPISGRPLFFVAILMAIVGVQFFSIGLIGEMITKTTIENDNVIIDKTLG
jgi:glycosyltransferase involved in cell wall biosynthesis